jgi:ankyrin repeat protein
MSVDDLFTAIERGDLEGVSRILLDEPGSMQATTAEGLTPVMVAAYWGQAAVLERLLEATDRLGFWEAATVGATARLTELLDETPELITAHSPDGFTALHLASFFGHPETVRALIEAGADVSARTSNALDNQPLHAAVAGSEARARLACARLLVAEGADVNGRQSGGYTPLMSALRTATRTSPSCCLPGAPTRPWRTTRVSRRWRMPRRRGTPVWRRGSPPGARERTSRPG